MSDRSGRSRAAVCGFLVRGFHWPPERRADQGPGRGPMVRKRHTAVHVNVAGVPQSRTRHERVLREDARLRATAAQSPACRRRGVRRYDSGAVGAPKFRATRSVGKRGWASLCGHGNRFFVAHPAHRTAKLSGPSDGRGALPACAPRPPNGLSSMPSQTSLPLRPRAFKQLSLWRHAPRGGGQPHLAPAFYLRKNAFRLRAFRRLDHLGNSHRSVRWTMSLAGTCCGRRRDTLFNCNWLRADQAEPDRRPNRSIALRPDAAISGRTLVDRVTPRAPDRVTPRAP